MILYNWFLSHILILTVISSVIGLIYLFEIGLDFSNNHSFSLILNLITVVLGSILIPSIFLYPLEGQKIEH